MPAGSIEGRAARVSFVNGISTGLTLLFQLVSVPVCLHYWGKGNYGSWLAVLSSMLLLRSLDGGYAVYVGNRLNLLYHSSIPDMRRHLASAMAGVVVISLIQLLLVAGTFFMESLAAAMGVSGAGVHDLSARYGLLVLMVCWVLTGSYIGIVDRLFIPANLMHQAAYLAMGLQVLQFISIMVSATLRLDLPQTCVLFSLSQTVIYLSSLWYARTRLPEFFPLRDGLDWRTGMADLKGSLLLTASNLVQQTATSGAVLMVAFLSGPAGVPVFTTIRTLMNLWTQVTTVLSSPLLPDVVRFHARDEAAKVMAVNQAFWVLAGSIVNLGTLLAWPVLPSIYGRWTTHAVTLDSSLLGLMLGAAVVTNAGALIALHLNGINSLRIVLAGSLLRAILGLGVGLAGFGRLGLASFGLGILVAEVIVVIVSGRYFVRHELAAKGVHLNAAALAPALVGTGSAALFFLGSGLGWWSGAWPWLLAVIGTICGSVWGWRVLAPELQGRIIALPLRLLRRR